MTSAGPVALTVPRGRLRQADGTIAEWHSTVLPRYARRTAALDTTLARLYLSGASTRDLRRAVAPLFGTTALSKSAVSRVVTRLLDEYHTWQQRSLADEPIAYLYLDGQRHRVRADGRMTWISVLMALGVRTTGEKVVLGMRVVGDEHTAAWTQLLEDLTHRGLGRPQLVLSDGSKGAAAALAATWPGLAHQRCLVHKLRNLIACVPRSLRGAVVRDFQTITTATTPPAAVHATLAAIRRTWALKWSAVVVSLDEAGDDLTKSATSLGLQAGEDVKTFTALPSEQWRCLRTTNAIERVFAELPTSAVKPLPSGMGI
ncbi:MAG: IS256 family transposase [Gemmatimonadales bacterium]|nr:IS256 family transposase [Gemmatimonadales bacterium]